MIKIQCHIFERYSTYSLLYRLCGQVVSNNVLLEEHLTLCQLRASVQKKSVVYDAEIKRASRAVHLEMEVI